VLGVPEVLIPLLVAVTASLQGMSTVHPGVPHKEGAAGKEVSAAFVCGGSSTFIQPQVNSRCKDSLFTERK
jgi:hypothetical protein